MLYPIQLLNTPYIPKYMAYKYSQKLKFTKFN
jgi:hypothetical protein